MKKKAANLKENTAKSSKEHLVSVFAKKLTASVLFTLFSAGLSLIPSRGAFALNQQTWLLLTEPLDRTEVNQLWLGNAPRDHSVVSANMISQTGLTIPSLWWVDQQFGGDLVNFWVAHQATNGIPPHVDLLIDQQSWTRHNYLERYAFINQFGTAASDFGFHTRVFNWRGELLGAYICNFGSALPRSVSSLETQTAIAKSVACNVFLDPSGPGALRSGASLLGGSQSTGGGTGQ